MTDSIPSAPCSVIIELLAEPKGQTGQMCGTCCCLDASAAALRFFNLQEDKRIFATAVRSLAGPGGGCCLVK